jgi:hypothetical protein
MKKMVLSLVMGLLIPVAALAEEVWLHAGLG